MCVYSLEKECRSIRLFLFSLALLTCLDVPPPLHLQGWYSFDLGSAHFIMINTEFHCGPGSDQIKWVTDDLHSVNRSVTPWVIFMGHRQMYSGNSRDSHLSDCYEDVMLKYKVDLVLYGHIHNTQQTCPLYRSKCIEETDVAGYGAPIHAVVGNAGQSLTPAPSRSENRKINNGWMDGLIPRRFFQINPPPPPPLFCLPSRNCGSLQLSRLE